MWTYSQSTGELNHNGTFVAEGYSGTGKGRNSTREQATQNLGPIPQGKYLIGKARVSTHTGPITMDLSPLHDTNTFGRSLFRIHGNNAENDASHGCIILDRVARLLIDSSKDRDLEVIA